uniref:Uncharacterized protein n=1 Tax=Helianthus annuus TaxID=4232 RepID=A0A251VK55_HELAN
MFYVAQRKKKARVIRSRKHRKITVNPIYDEGELGSNTHYIALYALPVQVIFCNGSKLVFL